MPALTNPKHERFAVEVSQGVSATQAYVIAGYKPKKSSIQPSSARLLSNAMVKARIAEIQERSAIKTEITLASLIQEAAEIQEAAKADKQYSAATAAFTAKAKLSGHWVERAETENVNTNYVVAADPIGNVEDWEAEHSKH
jgi:phage terminase small subunit